MLGRKEVIGGNNITVYHNFISKEECEELIKFFDAKSEEWKPICFYGSYGMFTAAPLTSEHNTSIDQNKLNELTDRVIKAATDMAGVPTKINSMHAQKWDVGAYANDHSDNSDLEGNDMGWSDNKFATILYLNDDYEGGEIKFRDHNISLKLEPGALLAFPGGMENIHSVSEITAGTRYTVVSFQDYASAWYSEAELKELERMILRERVHQYQLKERWKFKEAHPILEDPYMGVDEYINNDDPSGLPQGFLDSLTKRDMKSNARRNQENAIKNGTVPPGAVVDMVFDPNEPAV